MLACSRKRHVSQFLKISNFLSGAETTSQAEIERHLEMGRDFLARGQLQDALSHYHAAVEGDSSNYLTYFKRGTVYFALGKAKFALSDFTKVLELKPDFTAARVQRGTVHLKLGEYDEAEIDLYNVLQVDPYNEEILYSYQRLNPAREQWNFVQELMQNGDYATSVTLLTQLLEVSPWSAQFRESRGKCYIMIGDKIAAVSDFRSVNRLSQDSTAGYYKLSKLLYELGHVTDALKEIRECLKLDPEHKDCFPFYKKIKKIDKFLNDAEQYSEQKDFKSCIESAEKVIKNEAEIPMVIFSARQYLCSCSNKEEQYTQAINHCKEALNIYKDPNVLCDKAEALIGAEMYDDGK